MFVLRYAHISMLYMKNLICYITETLCYKILKRKVFWKVTLRRWVVSHVSKNRRATSGSSNLKERNPVLGTDTS